MARLLIRIGLLGVLCVMLTQGFSIVTAQGPVTKRPVPRELQKLKSQRADMPAGKATGKGSAGVGSRGPRVEMRGMSQQSAAQSGQAIPDGHQISAADYALAKKSAGSRMKASASAPLNNDPARLTEKLLSPKAPIYFGASYPAIAYTGLTPPNPNVIPTQSDVLALANSTFTVYSKTMPPSVIGKADLASWFAIGFTWDPLTTFSDAKAIYQQDGADPNNERVYIAALATNTYTNPAQSWIVVAASLQSNAGYAWYQYRFDATKDGTTATANFAADLNLAVDGQNVYVTTNQYGFDGSGFKYSKIRMIKQSDMQNAIADPAFYDFTNPQHNDGTGAFTVVPASHYFTSAPIYLVSAENNQGPTIGNTISLFRIDLPASNNWPSLSPTLVLVNSATTAGSFSYPPDARQVGTDTRLDSGDDRILSARRYAGDVWATLTTARPDGRAGISVYKISTTGTVSWESAGFGGDGCDYFYPAVALDDYEDVALVFNRSCDDGYVGYRTTGMKWNETTLEASKFVKPGEDTYVNLYGTLNLWGHYSGIERDPFDLFTFWMLGSYATTPSGTGNTSGRWATWMYTAWFPPFQANLPFVGKGY